LLKGLSVTRAWNLPANNPGTEIARSFCASFRLVIYQGLSSAIAMAVNPVAISVMLFAQVV